MPVSYITADGESSQLTGEGQSSITPSNIPNNWTTIKHPDYGTWSDDEARQRASYIATRRALNPYLVPHRFEDGESGTDLRRSNFGFGIGLNKAYLGDIMGHISSADVKRDWGPLGGPDDDEQPGAPADGTIGSTLFADATAAGMNWDNFFLGTVQEWMLTSPGGFVLVDMPVGQFETMDEALRAGHRPFFKFVPMSWVWDYSRTVTGYRWIKLGEIIDERVPDPEGAGRSVGDTGMMGAVVLYELEEDGSTRFSRWTQDGDLLFEVNLGTIVNPQGSPILPLIPVHFGEHPEIDNLGAGLLTGLEDIVIDMYNTVSEAREAARNTTFPIITYRGSEYETAKKQLAGGSVIVNLGDDENAQLERVAADSAEVEALLRLLSISLSAWALAARRKAADAVEDSAQARSGVALQAEFQLDLKPLLVSITNTLNAVEEMSMFVAAQLWGESPEAAFEVSVWRNQAFRLEEEASRISRIVEEFIASIPLSPEIKTQAVMRWLEHSDIFDLDAEAEGGGTLREKIEEEVREMFQSEMEERKARTEAFRQDLQNVRNRPGAAGGGGGGDGDDEE